LRRGENTKLSEKSAEFSGRRTMAVAGPYLKAERSAEMQSAREATATKPVGSTGDDSRDGDVTGAAPWT
jgi:hypothetical protein